MNLKEGDALREGRERKKETERERVFFWFFSTWLAQERRNGRKEIGRISPLLLFPKYNFLSCFF